MARYKPQDISLAHGAEKQASTFHKTLRNQKAAAMGAIPESRTAP